MLESTLLVSQWFDFIMKEKQYKNNKQMSYCKSNCKVSVQCKKL